MRNPAYTALRLAAAVLEGDDPKDFLARHNLRRVRQLQVTLDGSNPGWFNIPVLDRGGRPVNMFYAPENPKPALKERLQQLLRKHKGYAPGDIFVSPWGRFLVTDVMGIKEV